MEPIVKSIHDFRRCPPYTFVNILQKNYERDRGTGNNKLRSIGGCSCDKTESEDRNVKSLTQTPCGALRFHPENKVFRSCTPDTLRQSPPKFSAKQDSATKMATFDTESDVPNIPGTGESCRSITRSRHWDIPSKSVFSNELSK